LYGEKSKQDRLAIMKDSRTGAIGVVALLCVMALKWAGLAGLEEDRFLLLLLIPAYARAGCLFGFYFLGYGRPGGGTAGPFFETSLTLTDFRWLLLLVVMSIWLHGRFWLINCCFAALIIIFFWFYKRKIGCITGDMLGAMIEFTEALLFLGLAV